MRSDFVRAACRFGPQVRRTILRRARRPICSRRRPDKSSFRGVPRTACPAQCRFRGRPLRGHRCTRRRCNDTFSWWRNVFDSRSSRTNNVPQTPSRRNLRVQAAAILECRGISLLLHRHIDYTESVACSRQTNIGS